MATVYELRADCPVCGVTLRLDRVRTHVIGQHPTFPESRLEALLSLADDVVALNPGRRIAFDLRSPSAEMLDLRKSISLILPSMLETRAVLEAVRDLTPELIRHLRLHGEDLHLVPWNVFEHLVAELLASMGFEDVALVGRNSATAADIFAAWRVTPIGHRLNYFVEVKRWKDRVGVEVIEKAYGAMLAERPRHGWHAAMIVSLVGFSEFERHPVSHLKNIGIELKDKKDLLRWLAEYEPTKGGL
jgi:Restriction endonuclease